jgi:uncharacterized integral membrane protein
VSDEPREDAEPRLSAGDRMRAVRTGLARGIAVGAVVLFAAFAVANRQAVDFNWLFGESVVQEAGGERIGGGVPLILLLLGAFFLGLVTAWAAMSLQARHDRRRDRSH